MLARDNCVNMLRQPSATLRWYVQNKVIRYGYTDRRHSGCRRLFVCQVTRRHELRRILIVGYVTLRGCVHEWHIFETRIVTSRHMFYTLHAAIRRAIHRDVYVANRMVAGDN